MPKNNESTMQWKVDIAQFKKNIQDAKRQISLANAEFKTATAGMGKWANSITGVESKIKQLNTVSANQKTVLAELQKQYDIVAREMGEDSEAAQKLKIQIENQKAAISKTDAEISKYNSQLGKLEAEQKQAESATGKLTNTIEEQESALADLKSQYANAVLEYGKNSKEAKSLAKEISSLSTELAENKTKLNDAEKAADRLDNSIDDAGESARDAANGGFTVLKGTLANLAAEGVTRLIDGMRELGRQLIDIGKQSITGYAAFEQLEGGVNKLFGDASKTVMDNAKQAFSTAGMSANEYMETVTSFSASLISGLGGDTEEAARIADIAIRNMSDNANTFGTDIASIQNAYQGFAKQNYTMLDNLKLGYGGTQAEMARLVNESGVLNGKFEVTAETVKDLPFATLIEAINETQKRMSISGLTAEEAAEAVKNGVMTQEEAYAAMGTTAKEAASTLEGSYNSMKAAWSNFLVNLSSGEDVSGSFDALINAASTVWDNLKPVLEELIDNVVTLIRDELTERFPEAMEAFDKIKEAVSTAFQWILDNKDALIAALSGIAAGITALLIAQKIEGMIKAFKAWKLATEGMTIAQRLLNAAQLASPIGLIIAGIAALVTAFVVLWNKSEAFRNFWIGLWESIKTFMEPIIEAIKGFFTETIPAAIDTMVTFFSELPGKIWKFLSDLLSKVIGWANNMVTKARETGRSFLNNVVSFITQLPGKIWGFLSDVISKVGSWAGSLATKGAEAARGLFNSVVNGIKGLPGKMLSIGTDIVKGIWEGISGSYDWIKGKISGWVGNVTDFLKNLFGIGSPSKLMRDEIGKWLPEGIAVGFDDDLPKAESKMKKAMVKAVNQLKVSAENAKGGIVTPISVTADDSNRSNVGGRSQIINFNQTINSPKAVDRLTLYRETNSMLFNAKVGLSNV